jgi:pimeloyl-ACP methyl ester carboxylesterase
MIDHDDHPTDHNVAVSLRTNDAHTSSGSDVVALGSPQTRFLPAGSEQVCVVWHPPAAARARDTAVIICPPFGWDEICSYRSRRDWAQQLATAGYPTLRITFPGTGDSSGGPLQAGRLQAWTDAVGAGGDWLREVGHVTRIALIGLGLGGLVGYHAAATGLEIDDLVLWATPARGRELVRQLRAFSRLESSELGGGAPETAGAPSELGGGEPDTAVASESGFEVGGFRLSDETLQDLSALDLTAEPGPLTSRRVLLFERDGLPADRRLLDHLESLDVDVTVAPGEGYAAMIAPPQQAVTPAAVITAATAWLDLASAPAAAPLAADLPPHPRGDPTAIAAGAGSWVRETPITIAQPVGELVGILTEPSDGSVSDLCVVLLNAGGIRRIGPNRMWVEAARRWALQGVPTLRLDVEALGDSDGDIEDYRDDKGLYVPKLVPQALAAVDALQQAGVAERFALGGLCSGAYWAYHAALQDPRVVAAWMINPRILIWDPGPSPERDLRTVTTQPLSLVRLRKAFGPRGLSLARFMLTTTFRRVMRRGAAPPLVARRDDELRETLNELRAAGKHAVMVFAQDEPLYDAFAEAGLLGELEQAPEFRIERVAVSDHTIRPGWAQRAVHAALDRALDEELERAPRILAP